MSYYGLVDESGVLVQRQTTPSDGFVAIPEDVVCGMVYDEIGDIWYDPEIPLSSLKAKTLRDLVTNYNVACEGLMDVYMSPFERLTWNTQVFEADLVNASGSPGSNDVPFFDGFIASNPDFAGPSSTDNENRALLKSVVEANNAVFAGAAGNLTGQLSKKRHDILGAADESELDLVDLTFVIPSISVEDKF